MKSPDAWVELARVAKPHGIRGELHLSLFNPESEVLVDQDEVLVRLPDGTEHEVSVDAARRANDAVLMKLHSIDDRNRADELRGALVCVRRRELPPLDEGEFYACDIDGAKVFLEGAPFGVARDLVSYPTVDALYVETDAGDAFEVPLVDGIVEALDLDAGEVRLSGNEGIEKVPRRKGR